MIRGHASFLYITFAGWLVNFIGSPASGLLAQATDKIVSATACLQCHVVLSPVVTLGDQEGPGIVGGITTITQTANGRYVLSFDGADSELSVFSPTGRFIRRLGGRGRGPGEYESVRWVSALGNKLHVFDTRQRRQTVLSHDYQVLRTNSFQGHPLGGVSVINDTLVIMNGLVRTRQLIGFLLHGINHRGELIRSIALEPGGFRFDLPGELYYRSLSVASSGGIWAAHRTQYRIDEWSLDGTLRQTITRPANWFPSHPGGGGAPDPSRPPLPALLGAREDGRGRLWLMVRVTDGKWAQSLTPVRAGANREEGRYRIDDINRAFDTIVEVVDIRQGTLITSTRVDQALVEFVGTDQAVSYYEDAQGTPKLQMWRLSIHSPTTRR